MTQHRSDTHPSRSSSKASYMPTAGELQKSLSGMDYPASKQQIVETARQHGADRRMLDALAQLPDREYDDQTAISREVSRH